MHVGGSGMRGGGMHVGGSPGFRGAQAGVSAGRVGGMNGANFAGRGNGRFARRGYRGDRGFRDHDRGYGAGAGFVAGLAAGSALGYGYGGYGYDPYYYGGDYAYNDYYDNGYYDAGYPVRLCGCRDDGRRRSVLLRAALSVLRSGPLPERLWAMTG